MVRNWKMLSLINFSKVSSFINLYSKKFNLTCPTSHHNKILSWPNVIMLNLISVESMKLITLHWPYIKCGISLTSCCDNELFIFRYVNSWSITFKNVSIELFCLLEVNSFFSKEFIIHNRLVESQSNVIILCTDTYCCWRVVI